MSDTQQAARLDWRIHNLNAEMMAALEESGGEFTPEVEAIETRLMKDVDAFAELGAAMKVYARQMQGMCKEERKRIKAIEDHFRKVEGIGDRMLRIAGAQREETSFEVGKYRVSLRTPQVQLTGGPRTRSDGWVSASEVDDKTFAELSTMSANPKALASLGWKPDRKAILAEVKKGAEVLDYAAERPTEKTVVVK